MVQYIEDEVKRLTKKPLAVQKGDGERLRELGNLSPRLQQEPKPQPQSLEGKQVISLTK